jgi:hypothetical protein
VKKLHFQYLMQLKFSADVIQHSFALRCVPQSTVCQSIGSLTCAFNPVASIALSKDSFGNMVYTGYIPEPHRAFSFRIEGTAVINSENFLHDSLKLAYKYPSPLANLQHPAQDYFPEYRRPGGDNLQKAMYFMGLLSGNFKYQSGSTNIHTTAEMALKQGCGVCQDYAHILIAMCRQEGIPARYVAGFMIGEGVTHAWVEIYIAGKWVGLDPTHNRMVDDLYIRLSSGRDFGDCIIDRGIFRGNAHQNQKVLVKVEEES